MDSYAFFEDAVAAADEDSTVCGTLLKSGAPAYFVMPRSADDEQIRDVAFRIREGRDIGSYELALLSAAAAVRDRGVSE
jgi:hypothetical protein